MTSKTFELPVRIYWEDTDAGGIVYHANYLRYMERARSDMLRAVGYEQNQMKQNGGPLIVVANLSIAYRRPALLDDLLTVRTRITSLKRASCIFEQNIYRGKDLICTGTVRAAAVDPVKGVPVVFPDDIFESFRPYVDEA